MKRLGINLIVLLVLNQIFVHSVAASSDQWNLNDVSYLFPLPVSESETLNSLLEPSIIGAKGTLLPKSMYSQVPTLLNAGHGNPTLFKGAVRVVSLRVDPCPSAVDSACAPEIRLVWQPIEIGQYEKRWVARDAALHSFYTLSGEEFESFKKQLWQLKLKNLSANVNTHLKPLGVHPALLNQNTKNAFNDQLQRLVLRYCGESNLGKVTFMSLLVPTRWWRFGSFVSNGLGGWDAEEIPRLWGAITEDLFNVAVEDNLFGPGVEMDSIINVLPDEYPEIDDISQLINKSYRNNDASDEPIFKDKLNAVARFRNPHMTNPSSLDCVSCHYADASLYYAERKFPQLRNFVSEHSYKNPELENFNLENKTIAKKATRIIRAFGYFNEFPALNQRTIHDSAESAHWMNTHF